MPSHIYMKTLTVYYPPATRYDLANGLIPFSGSAGQFYVHRTFDTVPDLTLDIRPFEAGAGGPPGDLALVLGAEQCGRMLGSKNINKLRGFRHLIGRTPAIATYSHMDCWDFKDDSDDDDSSGDSKDVAVTKRSNYLFWALADFNKLLTPPRKHHERSITIYPSLSTVTDLLNRRPPGLRLVIDIETRVQDNTLDAIGLGLVLPDRTWVYTIPIYRNDNSLAYAAGDITAFWRALYRAFCDPACCIIGHNLSFDLSILHHYYALPLPRQTYDTMLFMHRHNPFIDKSLSHAISYYTDAARNHKGDLCPNTTAENFRRLLEYNAEDIYWTAEVYRRQAAIADPSLQAVADWANRIHRVCLIMGFTGICQDLDATTLETDRLSLKCEQLRRCIRILLDKPDFNPASPKQLADWFYGTLGYEPPALTASGQPATDAEALLELQLKQPNPLIPLILEYKTAAKALSDLKAEPYEAPRL